MPRNSSGTMTLPAPGVPFQSGQTISSAQVNATLSDLATEVGSSLDRAGRGGMTAPLRVPDGTAAAPAVAFGGEINSGLYRAANGDVRLAIGGVDMLTRAGIVFPVLPLITTSNADTAVQIAGNKAAGSIGAELEVFSKVSRTAGLLAQFWNLNLPRLNLDYQGLLRLDATAVAAAIQPASVWTAITPNAGWTLAILDTGYHKDALGFVHVRGGLTNNTGASTSNILTTNPLPVGFRPATFRLFTASVGSAAPIGVQVNADGTIIAALSIANGGTVYLDVIQFMAQ